MLFAAVRFFWRSLVAFGCVKLSVVEARLLLEDNVQGQARVSLIHAARVDGLLPCDAGGNDVDLKFIKIFKILFCYVCFVRYRIKLKFSQNAKTLRYVD
jgi:hypothetical protein